MARTKPADEVTLDERSAFDFAVAQAFEANATYKAAVAKLEDGLSAKSFLREACANAGDVTDAELDELAKRLNSPGFEAALQGLNAAVRSLTKPSHRNSRPHTRVSYHWTDEGKAQLGAAGATPLHAFALASRIAAREAPTRFGAVSDYDKAEKLAADLKAELAEAIKTIETSWSARDVVVEGERVSFRRFPNVVVSSRDLGQRILSAAARDMQAAA